MDLINQKQEDRIAALEKGQKEILDALRPISETFITMSKLGKWGMAALVLVSVIVSILLSVRSLIHPK